jgi:hypothetical protein
MSEQLLKVQQLYRMYGGFFILLRTVLAKLFLLAMSASAGGVAKPLYLNRVSNHA